ncbi:2-oxo-4-hydroxy-4-carboxy-5-ureidoimidazoline decarboxylase [Halopolyspora algeriensis]|uniref:2-oxo-4-hydroxy-4-carboxy-5-ureidoimidazoline decarboxylase n=1 Tax=Halopolyspora algeriensis TaxID=1500506 RepID=A0A368VZA6_9ACTN|nr:2-oxo-4-hydroxy-4-carboxy-5-ureidoimidazoline decarboxylase [Halopolyspora algeriensis]RCW46712.1 2-oxo-4-hydroxy-4-carboxy-5-ureidoimidazoline decarboxylase [Halopolyspora algeriensis]TQM46737.1 2-oxo-4-hydroxy-4-carboxy-5-ureidoimidazoline decarboxylase [Halopolyspora algeriensis]
MSAPSSTDTGSGLGRVNSLPRPELIKQLLACLDVQRWAHEIADRRPFADAAELYAAADAAAPDLTDDEIHTALAAHPRIGERSQGSGTSSTWSRSEQSGVDAEDAELVTALREGNEEYERRFGHVYLVCASGRSGAELLEILRSRLDNDRATEMRIVADELRKIARLRLARVIES